MQRLAVICVATAIIFGILAVRNARENREVLAASPQAAVAIASSLATASSTTGSIPSKSVDGGIASASKVSVVASNVAARALTLNPSDTNATNRPDKRDRPQSGVCSRCRCGFRRAHGECPAGCDRRDRLGRDLLGDGGAATSAQLNLISASAVAERSGGIRRCARTERYFWRIRKTPRFAPSA